jgi:hypothetical protein
LSLCLRHISHGLTWNRTQASPREGPQTKRLSYGTDWFEAETNLKKALKFSCYLAEQLLCLRVCVLAYHCLLPTGQHQFRTVCSLVFRMCHSVTLLLSFIGLKAGGSNLFRNVCNRLIMDTARHVPENSNLHHQHCDSPKCHTSCTQTG